MHHTPHTTQGMSTSTDGLPVRHLFEVPIHALSLPEVLKVVDDAIHCRKRMLIGVVNAAKMVNMRRDSQLAKAVLSADLVLADGMAVVWACRLLGRRLPERIAGIDLMDHLLEHCQDHGHRVYCLGATQEVLMEAVREMRRRYPRVQIVGQHHGYFSSDEEPQVIAEITACRPDVLFVAMSSPRKEDLLARWADRMNVPVCHGVGGSFDVWAGKVKRAPQLWQRMGMEWLYRVIQEPRRMLRRYVETNAIFCWMVLHEAVRQVACRCR